MISGIKYSSNFKKQFKKYQYTTKILKRYKDCYRELLEKELVELDPKWKNHRLSGEYEGFWELHLFPDVLLIYEVKDNLCILSQIGIHADLLGD
jgi:mRNA interferase YafQ